MNQTVVAKATHDAAIDQGLIDRLVEDFYALIRADALLAPVFARITDWPQHLGRMKLFWASVLLGSGEYSGNPMIKHIAIPGIEAAHFHHWLALFEQSLDAIAVDSVVRARITGRARAIASSLLTGIRIHRDGRRDLQALKGIDHA